MVKYAPMEAGSYTPTEAAHYLQVPLSTLRAWVLGQNRMKSVIQIADRKDRLLSFNNLVEIHVLAAIRKGHNIPLPKIRRGLKFVENKLETRRPLLNQNFETDGLSLFVQKSGVLLNVTEDGQSVFRETVKQFLKRVERDPQGVPIRLYPFSRHAGVKNERKIVIDPKIKFGRPILVGTGVPTANVFERFLAGEPVTELAEDFKVDLSLIEEAIRCEQVKVAAA